MNDSAAYDAGHSTGTILGLVIIVVAPIAIGYFVGDRLAKKRGIVGNVKWPIRVGFAVSLILLLGYCAGQNNPARAEEISTHG